ncbi:MAG TPA: hypothetical protein VK893_04255, partial [Pyrinomonadaceae bacterium]|nr:hypothetical protein [Pyrinomonadaceae bacterium]
EKPAPQVERIAPPPRLVEPVSRAVARAAASSTVVRTLKDPPEIWDLVHPAPKGFDARSAFVARLSSMRAAFAFRALTVVVLASVCAAVGIWLLRGVQARSEARSEGRTAPQIKAAAVADGPNTTAPNAPVTDTAAANAAAPSAVPANESVGSIDASSSATLPSVNVDELPISAVPNDKPVYARRRSSRSNAHRSEQRPSMAINDVSQPSPVEKPTVSPQTGKEPVTTRKNSESLSPQMIAPVRSATPKPKVIQWP